MAPLMFVHFSLHSMYKQQASTTSLEPRMMQRPIPLKATAFGAGSQRKPNRMQVLIVDSVLFGLFFQSRHSQPSNVVKIVTFRVSNTTQQPLQKNGTDEKIADSQMGRDSMNVLLQQVSHTLTPSFFSALGSVCLSDCSFPHAPCYTPAC